MKVTTTYYRDFSNTHWYTRIGKFSFYSVAKPTARQIRRWKKLTKRVNWFEYNATVNARYGMSFPNKTIWQHLIDGTARPRFTEIFEESLRREIAGFPVKLTPECNSVFVGADMASGPDTTASIIYNGKVIGTGRVVDPEIISLACVGGQFSIGYRTDISRSQFESEYVGVFTGDNNHA